MIDYWSKLKLDECWSKKQRFNKIMNYLMNETDVPVTQEPTDNPVEEPVTEPEQEDKGNVSVTVTNEEGDAVANADVSIYDNAEPFEGTTGSAGGCTIRNVPYGAYTIEAVADGYDFTVDTININSPEMEVTLVLKLEVDDDI